MEETGIDGSRETDVAGTSRRENPATHGGRSAEAMRACGEKMREDVEHSQPQASNGLVDGLSCHGPAPNKPNTPKLYQPSIKAFIERKPQRGKAK